MPDTDAVLMPAGLQRRLLTTVLDRAPTKSFGYLLSDRTSRAPADYVLFQENIRNDRAWVGRFQAYGRYFVDHDSAGFVATPEESWRVQRRLLATGMVEVALFHTHHRHPGGFSEIDYDMHVSRFENLWHLIISLRNPSLPQLRAYAVSRQGVRELDVRIVPEPHPASSRPDRPKDGAS